jgi:hypothetical protein
MPRSHAVIFALFFTLAACDGRSPTQPSARTEGAPSGSVGEATISRGSDTEQYDGLVIACNGEPFQVSGTYTYRWHTVALNSGAWSSTLTVSVKATGEGSWSGAKYRGTGSASTTQIFMPPKGGAFVYSQMFRMLDVTQGGGNQAFSSHTQWTVTPDGRVTSDHFTLVAECR